MRNRRLPRQKRVIVLWGDPVKGDGQDYGRYYRCWNCGFIIDSERTTTGEGSGVAILEASTPAPGASPVYGAASAIAVLDGGITHYQVALPQQADGTAQPIRHTFSATASAGCPFCGTKNWR